MIQDILPYQYHNQYEAREPQSDDFAMVWKNGQILLKDEQQVCLPLIRDIPYGKWQYLFSIDERAFFLCMSDVEILAGFSFQAQKSVTDRQPQELAFAVCAGGSLARWYGNNHFCGACASEMQHSRTERAMVCPACGNTVYPKICPAVIVAVTDKDRLLLTKYAGRAFNRYALVAGFTEIGETVEDTVHREVLEETGLKVRDLHFYKSQPWGFTDSLLIGFFCRLSGDSDIILQEDELAEAEWFDRENLSYDHTGSSLTGEMIEYFRDYGSSGIWHE